MVSNQFSTKSLDDESKRNTQNKKLDGNPPQINGKSADTLVYKLYFKVFKKKKANLKVVYRTILGFKVMYLNA